jgi:hypothetical protein
MTDRIANNRRATWKSRKDSVVILIACAELVVAGRFGWLDHSDSRKATHAADSAVTIARQAIQATVEHLAPGFNSIVAPASIPARIQTIAIGGTLKHSTFRLTQTGSQLVATVCSPQFKTCWAFSAYPAVGGWSSEVTVDAKVAPSVPGFYILALTLEPKAKAYKLVHMVQYRSSPQIQYSEAKDVAQDLNGSYLIETYVTREATTSSSSN